MDNPIKPQPLLSIRGLTKTYSSRNLFARRQTSVEALRGINLDVHAKKILGIIGPSGSGKSTLARCIAGLDEPTTGEIRFAGEALRPPKPGHRRVQMVFQDPGASLNPRFSVAEALLEPGSARQSSVSRKSRVRATISAPATLRVFSGLWMRKLEPAPIFPHRPLLPRAAADALEQVGLPMSLAARRTSELSGGQKVRLALARALAALDAPEAGMLILDESLSGMDLCVRAQIVNLLLDLQEQRGLTYILITHDPDLARHLADDLVVMSEGRIAEQASHA